MKANLQNMKKQLTLFFYAISYFTRLPIPSFVKFDKDQFHKANAYLALIGAIVALLMMGIFYLSHLLFSLPISLMLMLIGGLCLTGALHEDGLADCCDGLGGGYNATQRLKIMKDSQIGSYGGIALIACFLLKFLLLIEIAEISIGYLFIALLAAHALSRYGALCLMQSMPYVRLEEGGKVEGLAVKLNRRYFIFASLSASSVLLLLTLNSSLLIVPTMIAATLLLRKVFMSKLEGYTGDCLGFSQQCLELLILLLLTVPFTYIN